MNFQALYLMDLSFYPFLSLFRSLARSLCLFRYSPDAFAIANGPLVRFLCLFCFFILLLDIWCVYRLLYACLHFMRLIPCMFAAYGMDSRNKNYKPKIHIFEIRKIARILSLSHKYHPGVYTQRGTYTSKPILFSWFYCITLNWSECECDCVWQIKELRTTTPNNGKEMDNNR